MSHDALFQLGMGPVRLDATQTEDAHTAQAIPAGAGSSRAARAVEAGHPTGFQARHPDRHPRRSSGRFGAGRDRGNSAKALIAPLTAA